MSSGLMSRLDRFCWFMTRYRLRCLAVVLVLTVICGYGMLSIRGEVILQDLFPYDHPYLKLHARFSQLFGSGGSGVAIAVKARQGDIFNQDVLGKVQKITNDMVLWDEVYRVLTVSIAGRTTKVVRTLAEGEINIAPLMWPDLPKNDEEMEVLKRCIFSDPAYRGVLVSQDGTAALIMTEFKENISYERAFRLLRELIREHSDEKTSVHIVGFPQLIGWIYSYKNQVLLVFGVSVGLMIVILFLIFRNFTGMATPIIFAAISTVQGIGFIGWTGINFSPLLYVLAFLVGARIISHAVQITHRYFEEYQNNNLDKVQACYETMRSMIIPNWAGVATDAAGFLVLLFAKIALIQQVAIFMSFWMTTVALSGVLTPILCSYLPIHSASEAWGERKTSMSLLDHCCTATTRFAMGSGRFVVAGLCVAAFMFCAWMAGHSKIGDPTPGTPLLWPDHPYNRDQELIDRTFDASSENYMLFYEGQKESVYDPIVLTTFEMFARHMQAELPDIYKSASSIVSIIKMYNLIYHDGDRIWYTLPRNEMLLTGLIGLIREQFDPYTLGRFIDVTDLERAQLTLFFADHTSHNLQRIKEAARKFFETHPMATERGEFKLAGGRVGMEMAVNDEMTRSHLLIDSTVLFAIFILCALFYRSLLAGLMLTVPLILANLLAFAYMAMANIGLSINTLPIAAVGVGVGVDFAIYIYSRCIEEFPHRNGYADTIMTAVRTSGKAVVYTGMTMILPIITWYFISDLKFQAQMGFFLAVIMLTNLVLAVTLHPLMLVTFKPAFISGQAKTTEVRIDT